MMVRWIALVWLLGSGAAGAQPVPAPRSFEAIAASPTEIRCYWLPADGATGYRLTRDGQPLATLPAQAREYADANLVPDSTHRYAVRALRANAESPAREYVERTFAAFPGKGVGCRVSGVGENPMQGTSVRSPVSGGGKNPIPDTNHPTPDTRHPTPYDVVIVQASSGGVAAAFEAARRGWKVALVEPTTRLGGMPVNGLSATDLRRPEHASGFLVRFQERVRALYAAEGVKTNGLMIEPRIAHQALKSLLYEVPNLTIYRRARLHSVHAVASDATRWSEEEAMPDAPRKRVESIVIEELNAEGQPTGRRATLHAQIFIDATDCGDLAAWAGAPFRLGREKRTPQEPHNGVIYYDRAGDKLLPGSTGEGDHRIQSYAYLFNVKDYGPNADKTIPKPPGYNREDYLHTPEWKKSWAVTSGKLPNGKYEINQHPQGSDWQGINYRYPLSGYKERERIEALYRRRVMGYLYYIQTEQGQKNLGLPDDEYRDSGGFPPLLYVREGRRILGEQLPVEADITQARRIVRPESIGIGDYPMDSHAVRPKTDWTTPDMGEGEWWLYQQTPWHALPFGVIVPQRLDNVFVTTAVSSTHVSFGTYRLEPVRMAFGQAAGIAASLCIQFQLTGRQVPAREVQDELLPHPANPFGGEVSLYYLKDVKPGDRHYRAIQFLAARGFLNGAEEFKPDAPTTRAEFMRWLTLLSERAAPPPRLTKQHEIQRAYTPSMGEPARLDALQELQQIANAQSLITRAEVAVWLHRIFALPSSPRPQQQPYADIADSPAQGAAEELFAYGISSPLWDGVDAFAPDGKYVFRPDAPLSHAELFVTLYLINRSLGPLFNDNPIDGKNGRAVPPALFESVTGAD